MKVIFVDKVPGVASRGDVRNVKGGFYRNFLQPNRKAVPATEPALKEWEDRRKKVVIEKQELHSKIEELKRRLSGAKAKIEKKVTAKGTLYGGVKAADIVKAVKDQFSIEIPVEAVELPNHIKAVGSYDVMLKLGEGMDTALPVEVVEKK